MSVFARIMQYALLYYGAGSRVVRETIVAPVTSSALTGLMQSRVAQFFNAISVLIRRNLSGARVSPLVLGKCAHVCRSRPTKKRKVGHICDYAWRPFLISFEIASCLDLGSDQQRQRQSTGTRSPAVSRMVMPGRISLNGR